ncbi:MAG: GNAT family N-acetyltransferase [Alphaproteobacteria bacterium]|nr:GNAT family N-acetyltransferase [Alphaproteobacteria bacterium]
MAAAGDGISFRDAAREDLPKIVGLLANDPLGSKRERFEDPLPDCYSRAFDAIAADPNNRLIVVEHDGAVIGTLQLTFIPNMTYQGGIRAQIEGVRVDDAYRSRQIGKRLFEWTIAEARRHGCHMVQLTADKTRPDAHRFYESLGFAASHVGMKLYLSG